MPVIRELDAKKNDASLGDRAARAIKDIRKAATERRNIRDGVKVEIYNMEILSEDILDGLGIENSDDRIVQLGKKYAREYPTSKVAIATSDYGMQLRAIANGIPVIEINASLRLKTPEDKLFKKYRKAVAELNELKNRMPNLKVICGSNFEDACSNEPIRIVLKQIWQTLDKETEILELKKKYPKRINSVEQAPVKSLEFVFSDKCVNAYNTKLEEYHSLYGVYIDCLNSWGCDNDRTIHFELWLENSGTMPATDIDVTINLPTLFSLVAENASESAKLLQRPQPPKLPINQSLSDRFTFPFLERNNNHTTMFVQQIKRQQDRDVYTEVSNDREREFTINSNIKRLKHTRCVGLGSFCAVFESWEVVRPFTLDCIISSSELSEERRLKIPIIVTKIADSENSSL